MKKEKRIQQINQIIESKKYLQNKGMILDFLKDRELRYYFLNKLPKKFDDLRKIRFLLEELVKDERPYELFKVLEESINEKNNLFIVEFLERYYEQLEEKLREGLFQEESLVIAQKILSQYPDNVNEIFNFIKGVLTVRGEEYKKFKTKREHRREKELISQLLEKKFSLYKEKKENQKIKKIITLIDKHFNLVGDDGEFVMYTPNNIFKILKDYIDIDSKNNFKKVVNLIIEQENLGYKEGHQFNGWELMGGGISQSGDQFSINDRHFISYALQPALENHYEIDKDKAWKFIAENCISRTKEEVSKERPDFLNRSVISILLKEYESGVHKQEAFEILSDFIKMPKGIPHKADLIFQVLKELKINDEDKWVLIEVSLDTYNRLPINVFVEQITTELAVKGYQKATDTLQEWAKNPQYLKQQGGLGEFNIIGNISKLLSEELTVNEGIKLLKDYLSSDAFKNDLDRFDAFEVGRDIARAIQNKPNEGLSILFDIYKNPVLTINQQTALTSSIRDIDKSRAELLVKIYREFLLPILKDLGNDITNIGKKISHKHARENIVEFANKLAKAKKFDETLEIIRIFINDSDPCTPSKVDPEDPKGKFDYHKKIIDGEDTNIMTTVRGHVCWVLHQFAVLGGRKYIPEIVNLVDQLHEDPNYYVRQQVCFPLLELARVRHTVLPHNHSERFLPKEIADEIERIAFDMLINKENQKLMAVMKSLTRVFSYIRSLDEKRAFKVVNILRNCGFDEVISESAPIFIFFAEFRKEAFKDPQWEYLGKYNDYKFKKLLEDLLREGSTDMKNSLAWHLWKLTKEAVPDKADIKNIVKYTSAFKISHRYLNILADSYDPKTFTNIYNFIQDNINKRFEECYRLWEKCLKKEKPVLEKLTKEGKVHKIYWWPFHDNGEILTLIKEKGRIKELLDSFEFLLGYPKEVNVGDIRGAVKILEELPQEYRDRVNKIFDKLVVRNPSFYDIREKWKKNK